MKMLNYYTFGNVLCEWSCHEIKISDNLLLKANHKRSKKRSM